MVNRIDARDLNDATFRYFADTCAAAARLVPAPPLPGDVDTAALIGLAVRHRIAAPVLERLASATRMTDPEASEALAARGRQHRFAAIQRAQRLIALSRTLSEYGIRHFVVKGAVLAVQLYGDIAARDSKDIDLLIDPRQYDVATRLLQGLDRDETFAPDAIVDESRPKHQSFRIDGIEVEVHSRLLDMVDFVPLPFDQLWERRVVVTLGPVAMHALSPVDTLLYLCAHGSEHCWFRLKWLQDIARIVVAGDPEVLIDAETIARRGGYDRILSTALQLVDHVFGVAPADGHSGASDRQTRQLVALSKVALAAPADLASEPTLGWLVRRSAAQLGLRRAWPARMAFLHHLFTSARSFDVDDAQPHWRRYLSRPVRLLKHHYARTMTPN